MACREVGDQVHLVQCPPSQPTPSVYRPEPMGTLFQFYSPFQFLGWLSSFAVMLALGARPNKNPASSTTADGPLPPFTSFEERKGHLKWP